MSDNKLQIIHYLNQYFIGEGGENKADMSPCIQKGPVGLGRAMQKSLDSNSAEIVATISCGDNYFAERIEESTSVLMDMINSYKPDALIAGPAFNAGRYGIACGTLCKAMQDRFDIPVITGMSVENPSVDLFRETMYIVETGDTVKGIETVIPKMIGILMKLINKQEIGRSSEEGYFPRGPIINQQSERTGAERAVTMLLNKLSGVTFKSEVLAPKYDYVPPSHRVEALSKALIALVTDGGLVPKGNPDNIESRGATHFGLYSLSGLDSLPTDVYEINHTGYDPTLVLQDPNRLVPLDITRELEKQGVIGGLHETLYSTAGAVGILENEIRMGRELGKLLKEHGISGVILTST